MLFFELLLQKRTPSHTIMFYFLENKEKRRDELID